MDWSALQNESNTYLGLFLALIGGALGLPIPEDIPLLLAGVALQQGRVRLDLVFATVYTAIVIGDIFIYSVGRYFGRRVFQLAWIRERVSAQRIRKLRKGLERHSFLTILVARHLFYLRTVTFLTCGAVKMRFATFLVADMIAALLSASVMIAIGYYASEHYQNLVEESGEIHVMFAIGAFLLLAGAFLVHRAKRQKQTRREESSGDAVIDAELIALERQQAGEPTENHEARH